MENPLEINHEMAERYLNVIDPNAFDSFTFAAIEDERKPKGQKPDFREFHGSYEQHKKELERLNNQGYGIFIAANRMKDKFRNNDNVAQIRGIYIDDDTGTRSAYDKLPLKPHMTVRTSSNSVTGQEKVHAYLFTEDIPIKDAKRLQRSVVDSTGADKSAKDIARLLRLPGYYHQKGEAQLVVIESIAEHDRYSLKELNEAIVEKETNKEPESPSSLSQFSSTAEATNDRTQLQSVIEALRYIPADDYHEWVNVGMILRNTYANYGFAIWDAWSRTSDKYEEGDCEQKWASFKDKDDPLRLGSLFRMANKYGCNKFTAEYEFSNVLSDQYNQNPSERLKLLSLAELENMPQPAWLLQDWIPEKGIGFLFGQSGHYKSFIVLSIALYIAFGMEFAEKRTKQGYVWYMANEGDVLHYSRAKAWLKHQELDDNGNLLIALDTPILGNEKPFADDLKALQENPLRPSLIIIDTMAKAAFGVSENDATEISLVTKRAERLAKAFDCFVLIIDHTGKNHTAGLRGSYAKYANADTVIYVQKSESGVSAKIELKKQKSGEDGLSLTLQRYSHSVNGSEIPVLVPNDLFVMTQPDFVIDLIQRKAMVSREEIKAEFTRKYGAPQSMPQVLKRLLDDRKIVRYGKNYVVPGGVGEKMAVMLCISE